MTRLTSAIDLIELDREADNVDSMQLKGNLTLHRRTQMECD